MVKQAVILAAGKSTRTYPLTLTIPKPLLRVGYRPNIENLLIGLEASGVERVVIVIGFLGDQICHRLGHSFEGPTVTFVEQLDPKGTGHALKVASRQLREEPFLVLNGDDLLLPAPIYEAARRVPSLIVSPHPQPTRFGMVRVDDGYVGEILEKPKEAEPGSLVSSGAYSLPYEVIPLLDRLKPAPDGELRLTDVMPAVIEKGLHAILSEDGWVPLTYPWDVLIGTHHLLDRWDQATGQGLLPPPEISPEASVSGCLEGPVLVERGALVEPGSKVIGPSLIGEGTRITSGSVIDASVIGSFCFIGPGATVRKSAVMDRVAIGREAFLSWSVISEDCEIGDQVTVRDRHPTGLTVRSVVKGTVVDSGLKQMGCFIAKGVVVGRGSVLFPGVKIWTGRKIPAYAEVVEDISDD